MNDPYFKPVIVGGILITILSIVFAPAIFLWAGVGGYITTRLVFKTIKETINALDGILLGLMSGLIGGALLNIFTVISLKSPENEKIIIRILEKNLPRDINLSQNLNEIFPSIVLTTCLLIIASCVIFSILGSYIGVLISKKNKKSSG